MLVGKLFLSFYDCESELLKLTIVHNFEFMDDFVAGNVCPIFVTDESYDIGVVFEQQQSERIHMFFVIGKGKGMYIFGKGHVSQGKGVPFALEQ
jgi:hypothetical protein